MLISDTDAEADTGTPEASSAETPEEDGLASGTVVVPAELACAQPHKHTDSKSAKQMTAEAGFTRYSPNI